MKFKGFAKVVMAAVAAMSMTIPAFAEGAPEQSAEQGRETGCIALAESVDDSTAACEYIVQEESPANPEADILGDDNGGSAACRSGAPAVLWDCEDGTYEGSCLPLYRGRKAYTNYKFRTSTKRLTVDLEMYADENWTNVRKLTVILYKKSLLGWSDCGQWTFPFSPSDSEQNKIFTGSHTFKALSDSTEYCIKLVNDSADLGGADSEYAVGCNICVSEQNPAEALNSEEMAL